MGDLKRTPTLLDNDGKPKAGGGPSSGGAPSGPLQPSLSGMTLDGRYEILDRIGTGAMGTVYAGRHVGLGRQVAVKVLKPELTTIPETVTRFMQEARALSAVGHPNIVSVFDVGTTPAGDVYFVMERLKGEAVDERMLRRGRFSLGMAVEIGRQVALGVGAAHAMGIVHRDLKSENIHIEGETIAEVRAKVLDFGIALAGPELGGTRLTQAGLVLGTPEFMAPEQAAGQPVDHRIDLYALGVVIYEMVCGEPPFTGPTSLVVMAAHINQEPPPLRSKRSDVAPEVEELVLKLLKKKPEDRYQTMNELARALEQLARQLDGSGAITPTPVQGAALVSGPWASTLPGVAAAPTAVVMMAPSVAGPGGAGSTLETWPAPPQAPGAKPDGAWHKPERPGGGTDELTPVPSLPPPPAPIATTLAPAAAGPVSAPAAAAAPAAAGVDPSRATPAALPAAAATPAPASSVHADDEPVEVSRSRGRLVALAAVVVLLLVAVIWALRSPGGDAPAVAGGGPTTADAGAALPPPPAPAPTPLPPTPPPAPVAAADAGAAAEVEPDGRGEAAAEEPEVKPTRKGRRRKGRRGAPAAAVPTPAVGNRAEADYGEGRSSLLNGQFRAAASAFRRVIVTQPAHAGAHRGLGMALAESGDRPAAARALRRYLTLAPAASDAPTIRRKLETLERPK